MDDEFLSELKQRADIVSVVSKYVQLERKGRLYWACCPFHHEKTPSFAVNEVNQFYHCFGCHEHGDVIKFVEKMENLPFIDSVRMLAQSVGMQLPENDDIDRDNVEKEKKHKDRLLRLLKDAAIYYNKNLLDDRAKPARDYMVQRKIEKNIATRFGIGCSLGFYEVINYLKGLGYTEQEMYEAGVVKRRDDKSRFYDAVGGRLVFPIQNIYGDVVAFCGRILEKDAKFAKYINTAETKIFTKGKNLYGINLLKRKNMVTPINNIIVVEGQMDVVSLHSAGFVQAVASMGTALTQDQAKLIKRFVDDVYICYDGDSAGKKATIRGLDILKEQNLNVFVMSLPDGMDPDDVIKKMGRDAFAKLMKAALPLNEFKLAYLKKLYDIKTKEGKAKYIENAIEVLKTLSDVESEVYIEYVAEATDTNKDFLRRQLHTSESIETDEPKKLDNSIEKKVVTRQASTALTKAKRFVLASVAHRKPYAVMKPEYVKYFDGKFGEISKYLLEKNGDAVFDVSSLYDHFPDNDEVGEIINFVFEDISAVNSNVYYRDCLSMITTEYLKEEKQKLSDKLKETTDANEKREILLELNEIAKNIKKGGKNE